MPIILYPLLRSATEKASSSIERLSETVTQIQEIKQINEVRTLVDQVTDSIEDISSVKRSYEELSQSLQRNLSVEIKRNQQLIELAGLGMIAENVSHELNSLLDRISEILKRLSKKIKAADDLVLIDQVFSNIKSLRRTASFLEPLTNASRQRRVELSVTEELEKLVFHYPKLESGEFQFSIVAIPAHTDLRIKANRGLILQVFDNLIANSIYWLKSSNTLNPSITITLKSQEKTLTFEDNGPGISPELSDIIFEPFISTKPDGRGLGLYIVRELLELERAQISLLQQLNRKERLYKFQIDLKQVAISS